MAAVLLFHLWPAALPGGFVGVDVFFVISGYLITGLLLREAERTGTISIASFYARRVRRLLPAATLVLFAIALATPLLPEAFWRPVAVEIGAAALYVENWLLAASAVDYLGAEEAASPVQHYWSLSIEEQFYVVWPLLMLGACRLAAVRQTRVRPILAATFCLAVAGSLAVSVVATRDWPEAAYFQTHARVWELGIGGLLALVRLPAFPARTAEPMRLAGLAAIAAAALLFSRGTAFPGYAALLPTLGAVAVIAAGGARPRFSSYAVLAARPAQYLGDISYSLYLWHWPLIVFYLALSDAPLTPLSAELLIALGIFVSHLTKIFVEDRFRHPHAARSPFSVMASGTAVLACTIVLAVGVHGLGQWRAGDAIFPAHEYPGAAAITGSVPVPEVDEFSPPLAFLKIDLPDAYETGCHVRLKENDPNPCQYGNTTSDYDVVLVGDSHAAHWIPAFEKISAGHRWHFTSHTKSSCPFVMRPVLRKNRPYGACLDWALRVLERLKREPPDIVIFTQAAETRLQHTNGAARHLAMAEAIEQIWMELHALGVRVVALADTPRMSFDPEDCISSQATCSTARTSAFRLADPVLLAQKRNAGWVGLVDMSDLLCGASDCPAVIGNVIVWRDRHHLTASYVRTLAFALWSRIEAVIGPRAGT